MDEYVIDYEIINYEIINRRINDILNNQNNKFPCLEQKPIGFTTCGFPLRHFTIGKGNIHVTYFAGVHGNEIIGVDYVLQLMKNLALGKGVFQNFESDIFTMHFLPVINPEGIYTTTYALTSLTKNVLKEELELFCNKYFQSYKHDDALVKKLNAFLTDVAAFYELDASKIINCFWQKYRLSNEITQEELFLFLNPFFKSKNLDYLTSSLQMLPPIISLIKEHQQIFQNVSIDCIPSVDIQHQKLKQKLVKVYRSHDFPLSTLANFYSNSNGVNLNDNNIFYYQEFKRRLDKEKNIYASYRENNLIKSVPGPIGMPNYDMTKPFKYEKENKALLAFFHKQSKLKINYASINCHSTGGLLYTKAFAPLSEKIPIINNILAKSYLDTILKLDKNQCGYQEMPKPERITGIGDILRRSYPGSFLLELSKMGGNPIGPYGDQEGNFTFTMVANFESCMSLLKQIQKIEHLYWS